MQNANAKVIASLAGSPRTFSSAVEAQAVRKSERKLQYPQEKLPVSHALARASASEIALLTRSPPIVSVHSVRRSSR